MDEKALLSRPIRAFQAAYFSHTAAPSEYVSCPFLSTAWRPLKPRTAERSAAGTVPLTFRSRSAPCAVKLQMLKELPPARYSQKCMPKTQPWPGATPFFHTIGVPKPLRASGVAPGHSLSRRRLQVQASAADTPPLLDPLHNPFHLERDPQDRTSRHNGCSAARSVRRSAICRSWPRGARRAGPPSSSHVPRKKSHPCGQPPGSIRKFS